MEFVPVDNMPLLDAVLEIQSVGKDLMAALRANVQTETQKNTIEAICTVIETQGSMINSLVELQIQLTDKIERIVEATQS